MTLIQWWTQAFVRSFSHYFLLPLMLLVIIVLAVPAPLLDFGSALGLSDLIVHDEIGKRLLVGLALGLLWVTVLYGGYLLSQKDCREKRVMRPRRHVTFERYALIITACFLATVGAVAVVILIFHFGSPFVARILENVV
jgi:hypothetical protein